MAVAPPLTLRPGDRSRLEALTRARSVRAGLAQRARMVLLAAEGLANTEIARRTGSTRPTVLAWRSRYSAGGINALQDKPRSGRPTKVDEIEVVATTLADDGRPPAHLGVAHWSSRLLANELGISFTTVARIWRKWGIQPRRVEAFKFSLGPELADGAAELHREPLSRTVTSTFRPSTTRATRGADPTVAQAPADHPALHPDPWLNLVEVSLGILTHQAIRRGTFASVHNLIEAIGALTDGWSDREDPAGRATATTAVLAPDRKANSRTQVACKRSSPAEVDLHGIPERTPNRPRNRMSLRAEFHGTRCGSAPLLDPPST